MFDIPIQMHTGEFLTRCTVWLALTLYTASQLSIAFRRDPLNLSWWLNSAGCVFFLGHVAAAFHYFYNWSHATAYADTARQSKELFGWDSGDGLYLNYIFGLVWLSEVLWARIFPVGYSTRPAFWRWSIRMLFLFMIFNGAFVFVRSNLRWLGLVLCLLVLVAWWIRSERNVDWKPSPKSS